MASQIHLAHPGNFVYAKSQVGVSFKRVMAKKKRFKFRPSRKSIITTVIVIAVLAAALGAGVLAQFLQRQNQQTTQPDEFTLTGGPPLPSAVRDSQNLAASGKVEEANAKIDEALAANPDATTTYELYIQRGINYQNEGKYPEALEQYRKAEAVKQDFKVVRAIGDLAKQMGDKALAIEYYRKAIELISPDHAMRDAEIERLQNKIKELGG